MNKTTRTPWLFLLVGALLLPGARRCSWGGQELAFREETKTLDTSKVDGVSVLTASGAIEVVASREEKIELRIVRRARGDSRPQAEAALDSLRVTQSKEGSVWKLLAEFPPAFSIDDASVDFFLRVPARMSVILETQDGAISVQSSEGKIQARSQNGAVRITGARDSVRVRNLNGSTLVQGDPSSLELVSHNGSVEVNLAAVRTFEKESSIECHNGSIALEIPAGFSAALSAQCGNGGIRMEAVGRWEKNASHEMRGALGTGGTKMRLASHNGDIHVWEKK